jgi:ADP-ribose pyrophosphatase
MSEHGGEGGRDRGTGDRDPAAGPADEALDWRLEERHYGDDLILFRARYDHCRHPVSGQVHKRIVLESVDWVNLVALTTDGRCVMVRQYRFGVGYATLETPGGMVDAGETPLAAAQRELAEETGYRGGTWDYLGAVEPNPAFHDHLCHHYLARGVVRHGEQTLGGGEAIRVELMTEQQVVAAVQGGELKHALALSALARVFDLWPRPFLHAAGQVSAL